MPLSFPSRESGPAPRPGLPRPAAEPDQAPALDRFPRHLVMLHNDDVHSMDYVVAALQRAITGMSAEAAYDVMIEAHEQGKSVAYTGVREACEHFHGRLASFGLTVTIERA